MALRHIKAEAKAAERTSRAEVDVDAVRQVGGGQAPEFVRCTRHTSRTMPSMQGSLQVFLHGP